MTPALANVFQKIRDADLPCFMDLELTDPNVRTRSFGETPLHIVATWGDVHSAKVLLDEGALIDVPAEEGCTALHEATIQGHAEMVGFLLERGADKRIRSNFGDFYEMAGRSKNPEIRKLAPL